MTEVAIEGVGLTKTYTMPHGEVEVLRGVDIRIMSGEAVCIMGPSGAGKSTLLHVLAGLDIPDAGKVTVAGEAVQTWKESRRATFRAQHIGMVFQQYHLLPDLDVFENALMPLRALGGQITSKRKESVKARLEAIGLGDRLGHRPVELSGGEQQRLAVVRALVNDPALLMADEPTGNLDRNTGDRLLDDLFQMGRESGRTLILVSHDPLLAARCDRTIELVDGRVDIPETV